MEGRFSKHMLGKPKAEWLVTPASTLQQVQAQRVVTPGSPEVHPG